MKSYWYISLPNRYPQSNEGDLVRVVQSVQIKKKYSIVEMTREAMPREIDECKLRYCGHGAYHEDYIQKNIRRYIK